MDLLRLAIDIQHPLRLQDPAHPFSAGSGLVVDGTRAWAVADDDLHLAEFDLLAPQAPGRALRLLPGTLPEAARERKQAKPDFESLLRMPPQPGAPHGGLWALPSGSTPQRERGVLLPFDATGQPLPSAARTVDLGPWYARLRAEVGPLNLEGALCVGPHLCLLQRRTGRAGLNIALVFDAQPVFDHLLQDHPPPPPTRLLSFDLGMQRGVALGFTDGTALDDERWLFSACAEDTDDSYHDGAVAGSVIGVADLRGQLHRLLPIDGPWKVEGVALQRASADGQQRLWMVTDADDRSQCSLLLGAPWA